MKELKYLLIHNKEDFVLRTSKNTVIYLLCKILNSLNKYESKFSVNSYGLKCLKCGTEIDRTTSCIKQSCVHCNSLKVQRYADFNTE